MHPIVQYQVDTTFLLNHCTAFLFVWSLSILCVYITVKCLSQVWNVLSLNCVYSDSSCVFWITQQKQAGRTKRSSNLSSFCSPHTSIWLLGSSCSLSSVRQCGRNTSNAMTLLIFVSLRKPEKHTLAGVCISTALGWSDTQLQRWCIMLGKRNKVVILYHLWLRSFRG